MREVAPQPLVSIENGDTQEHTITGRRSGRRPAGRGLAGGDTGAAPASFSHGMDAVRKLAMVLVILALGTGRVHIHHRIN